MAPVLIAQITSMQTRVLAFIRTYCRKHGRSPSYREIAKGIGLSVHAVEGHLDALEMEGLITREPGVSKSIRLVRRARRHQ